MIKVVKRDNEARKNYLIRVAIEMIDYNAYEMETIEYDEAESDAFCLAEDLRNEFDINQD